MELVINDTDEKSTEVLKQIRKKKRWILMKTSIYIFNRMDIANISRLNLVIHKT